MGFKENFEGVKVFNYKRDGGSKNEKPMSPERLAAEALFKKPEKNIADPDKQEKAA